MYILFVFKGNNNYATLNCYFQADHVCGTDENDIIDGVPMGSVRISVGYMTKIEDIKAVIKMIRKYFCVNGKRNQISIKYEKYHTILDKYTPTSYENEKTAF